MTEDTEIGVRFYINFNQWAIYLPYPSTEQTPATIKAYHRQRYRWGYGFMQTMKKLFHRLKNEIPHDEKAKRWRVKKMIAVLAIHGPIDWIIYYPLTLAITLLFILRVFKMFYSSFLLFHFSALTVIPWNPLNDFLSLIVVLIPIPSLIFISILLKHYWKKINFSGLERQNILHQLLDLVLFMFFIAPIFASYYVFPYVHAFINYLKNPQRKAVWVKTKRTKETL